MFWTIPFCSAQTWKNAAQFRFWATEQQSQMNSFGALLDAQLRAKASQSAFQEISLDTVLSGTMGLGEEEKIPLILLVRWNTPCIKKLGLALDLLAQREIAVVGVILTDADARFLHAYYRV